MRVLVLFGLVLTACSGSVAADEPSTDGGVDAGPFDCNAQQSSNAPGIAIRFTSPTSCTFTLAQAAAGISIPYAVVIDRDMKPVILTPDPLDQSRRDTPNASGLATFEIVRGGDQKYCLCDTGLPSTPDRTERELKAGTFPLAFAWDGVNWNGPSDTSNPKGKPFPPGVYTLEVHAAGEAPAPGGSSPFQVKATINVRIVP